MRHLTDCVRGEYRDRLIVTNPDLRLYTRALGIFQELQARIEATAPKFKDPVFVQGLARQMEQLRGRELPGFMSAQSFYMFIQEYIDKWKDPALVAVSQMRVLALEVATKLVEAIALSYPVLRDAYRGVASRILEAAEMTCTEAVEGVLGREKDPFTVNDFLQAHINKLRHDRFAAAVNGAFSKCKSSHDSWQAAKEEAVKEEMGDELKFIDFHQLQIENKQYVARIEERNEELLRLKVRSHASTRRALGLMLGGQASLVLKEALASWRDLLKALREERRVEGLRSEPRLIMELLID